MTLFRSLPACLATLWLAACAADAPAGVSAGDDASAAVSEMMPEWTTMDEIVVAYGTATAGPGGSTALALPVDATLTSINVVAGQRVRAGDCLAGIAAAPAARAAMEESASALALATTTRERTARLIGEGLATNDALAQADKALRDARVAVRSLPDALVAPADGVIVSLDATRGSVLPAGNAAMTFVANDRVGFIGGIEPSDLARVHAGDPVLLEALGEVRRSVGTLLAVSSAVNPATRLVDVHVAASAELLPNAAYRATITTARRHGWVVPADAITGDDAARGIWQVAHGKAHRVPVTVLQEREGKALVAGPLDPATALVTTGATQLSEGMQVRPAGSR